MNILTLFAELLISVKIIILNKSNFKIENLTYLRLK